MVGKRSPESVKFRAYIQVRCKNGFCAKDIYHELCDAYGKSEVSYATITMWMKKFKSGKTTIEDEPRPGRPRSVVTDKNIEKVREIIKQDARYTVHDIVQMRGISSGSVHFILRKCLKVRRITARWIPHLLTEKEKQQRVSIAKKLLKMYPSYNSRTFADFCTGDETWVHFFEPRRKINNKIWTGKQARIPCIARRLQSVKKFMYAIFYSPQGVVASVPINQGNTVTGRYYKSKILSKVEKYYKKRRPASGIRHICLLHDNAPPHKAQVVTKFLDERKVKVIPLPPYSPDLSSCDFFLFPKLQVGAICQDRLLDLQCTSSLRVYLKGL